MKNIRKNWGTYIVLSLMSVIALFPYYLMFVMGTYHSPDLFKGLPLTVSDYLLENLKTVLNSGIVQSYLNSMIVSVTSVVLCLFNSINIGYVLAKHDFKGKKLITMIVLMGMVLPSQVSIIGYVMEMRVWHFTNTLFSVICVWIANPFSAFFMMQFIRDSVPTEILESARMDGCSENRLLYQIVVPCIKPAVMTVCTLVFLWSWNNYMLPLITLNKEETYTLPLLISNIGVAYMHDYGAQMLALALSTFPIIVIFSFGSKYFIQGITAGAVKG